jgi:hypothetical protein
MARSSRAKRVEFPNAGPPANWIFRGFSEPRATREYMRARLECQAIILNRRLDLGSGDGFRYLWVVCRFYSRLA